MTSLYTRNYVLFVIILFLFFMFIINTPVSGETITQTFFETNINPDGYAYEINPTANGALWISDNTAGEIRSYQPADNLMTIYSGLGAVSDARADAQAQVWFIDQDTDQLGQLEPTSGAIQYWGLGESLTPFGTAVDPQDRIWVTLLNASSLYRFKPAESDSGELCSLGLGDSSFDGSYYLIDQSGAIWLGGRSVVHRLSEVSETQYQLTEFSAPDGLSFSVESLLGDGQGGLWFTDSLNDSIFHLDPQAVGGAAFSRYPVPQGTPYMLTRQNDLVWYSGQEPGVLGMLNPDELTPSIYVAATAENDVSPVCETISATTASATMTTETPTWTEVAYPLETLTGWMIVDLESSAFPWGITIAGSQLWAVDQGRQVLMRTAVEATISACKYSDADGDLATIGDRAPLAGWQMSLYQDDVLLGTQSTESSGCTSWTGLPLGAVYAVSEEQSEGWAALDPVSGTCELGSLTQAGEYGCDFVNWKEESNVYIPLVMR